MTRRYDALQEFFLAYFHPDWQLDDESRGAVVREFKRTSTTQAQGQVAADLTEILAEPLGEEDLHEKVINQYSLFYDPWRDKVSMRAWLYGLLEEMEDR